MVAHLYGLTEEEFAYILTTFPLITQEVKDAALAACHAFAPDPDDRRLEQLIKRGEGARLEFKVAARWSPFRQRKDDSFKMFVDGEMYVRIGNSKKKLTAQEAIAYQAQRWPVAVAR